MVTPNSRRSFLFGRRAPSTSWGSFCARLARTCQGSVRWEQNPSILQAWLIPAREGDLEHAIALCKEYGVKMMLDGIAVEPCATAMPLLWVEPGRAWATHAIEQSATDRFLRTDAGCKLSDLRQQGLEWVDEKLQDWSVAHWFASSEAAQWHTAQSGLSVIDRVQVRLSDGTSEVLGPFGASALTPLRSIRVQQMVPKLFELAASKQALTCARSAAWPARFRLDALMSTDGQEPNLAHLLAGHAGSLAWVQQVWFRLGPSHIAGSDSAIEPISTASKPAELAEPTSELNQAAAWLDSEIKKTFDPVGLFAPIQ